MDVVETYRPDIQVTSRYTAVTRQIKSSYNSYNSFLSMATCPEISKAHRCPSRWPSKKFEFDSNAALNLFLYVSFMLVSECPV